MESLHAVIFAYDLSLHRPVGFAPETGLVPSAAAAEVIQGLLQPRHEEAAAGLNAQLAELPRAQEAPAALGAAQQAAPEQVLALHVSLDVCSPPPTYAERR